ncbi:MAG TPA: thiamine-phosphate kinase [Rhizomicrobium sp.]|jgi:thiamine-monophosphate kinase
MSRPSDRPPRAGEFDLIARLFAPLAAGFPGAFGLTDDAAVLAPAAGCELVLKADSLIESVHFLRDDPPGDVARKALRRALSDLAAKGAVPRVYLLALALPDWPDMAWLASFAAGLSLDQSQFALSLVGGETNRTPGPLTITITAIGEVSSGMMIRRAGARVGDLVFVTGTIGDAAGGLFLARNTVSGLRDADRQMLVQRYRVPEPRLAFGCELMGMANASLDISDGLVADLGHLAAASHVRIEIAADRIPFSPALQTLWSGEDLIARTAGAGDDYEIAFTASAGHEARIAELSRATATRATCIGHVCAGTGVALLNGDGREILLASTGYRHF